MVDVRPTLVAIFCCVLKIVINQGKMILNILESTLNFLSQSCKGSRILNSSALSWRVVGFCNFHCIFLAKLSIKFQKKLHKTYEATFSYIALRTKIRETIPKCSWMRHIGVERARWKGFISMYESHFFKSTCHWIAQTRFSIEVLLLCLQNYIEVKKSCVNFITIYVLWEQIKCFIGV